MPGGQPHSPGSPGLVGTDEWLLCVIWGLCSPLGSSSHLNIILSTTPNLCFSICEMEMTNNPFTYRLVITEYVWRHTADQPRLWLFSVVSLGSEPVSLPCGLQVPQDVGHRVLVRSLLVVCFQEECRGARTCQVQDGHDVSEQPAAGCHSAETEPLPAAWGLAGKK